MSQPSTSLATTFLLLKSHEPACPPTITDAGSQAGQAFNQVLRYIAGCNGFQSQLFGWPPQPEGDDINTNDWMASIMPGTLAIFINWEDDRAGLNFLSPVSFTQAFQGLTTFFDVPKATMLAADRPFDRPVAVHVSWKDGDAAHLLARTKLPLQITIAPSEEALQQVKHTGEGEHLDDANGTVSAHADIEMDYFVRIGHTNAGARPPASHDVASTLTLSLMRTRYCSRVKEDLYDMIRSRRVD